MPLPGESLEEHLNENSSDSEEIYETDEDGASDESVSQSVGKLKMFSIAKNRKHFNSRRNYGKNHAGRFNAFVRHEKRNLQFAVKSKCGKYVKGKSSKKCSVKSQDCTVENTAEVPHKGKRCRLGGKAKAKPPVEENCEKNDSDEDADSFYPSRISLGYFQKYRDESGASTSYQREEHFITPHPLLTGTEELTNKTSEELELLELQQWGMSSMVGGNKRSEKLNRPEDILPDTF